MQLQLANILSQLGLLLQNTVLPKDSQGSSKELRQPVQQRSGVSNGLTSRFTNSDLNQPLDTMDPRLRKRLEMQRIINGQDSSGRSMLRSQSRETPRDQKSLRRTVIPLPPNSRVTVNRNRPSSRRQLTQRRALVNELQSLRNARARKVEDRRQAARRREALNNLNRQDPSISRRQPSLDRRTAMIMIQEYADSRRQPNLDRSKPLSTRQEYVDSRRQSMSSRNEPEGNRRVSLGSRRQLLDSRRQSLASRRFLSERQRGGSSVERGTLVGNSIPERRRMPSYERRVTLDPQVLQGFPPESTYQNTRTAARQNFRTDVEPLKEFSLLPLINDVGKGRNGRQLESHLEGNQKPLPGNSPALNLEILDQEFKHDLKSDGVGEGLKVNPSKNKTKSYSWSYKGDLGPGNWSTLYPTCQGSRQSPLNIQDNSVIFQDLPAFTFSNFDGVGSSFKLTNNGYTASVAVSGNLTVEGGALDGVYKTAELHFHWGGYNHLGSEHSVNGRKHPLELHIVNYAVKYGNLSNALKYRDGLAVLGTFYDIAQENPYLRPIEDGLMVAKYAGNKTDLGRINLSGILPRDTKHFYRYYGSLTTPPCYQSVMWTVFEDVQTISQYQMDLFRQLHETNKASQASSTNSMAVIDQNGGVNAFSVEPFILDNFRPVQPDHSRVIISNIPRYADIFSSNSLLPPVSSPPLGAKVEPKIIFDQSPPEAGRLRSVAPTTRQSDTRQSADIRSSRRRDIPRHLDLKVIQTRRLGPNGDLVSEVHVEADPSSGISQAQFHRLLRTPAVIRQVNQVVKAQNSQPRDNTLQRRGYRFVEPLTSRVATFPVSRTLQEPMVTQRRTRMRLRI